MSCGGGERASRRAFLGACGRTIAGAALAAAGPAAFSWALEGAPRIPLVDVSGAPLRPSALAPHENWVFHYPHVSTPVLLLRLDEPTIRQALLYGKGAQPYYWPGGIGPGRDIVAYLAICTHQLSYNSPQVSYLSYHKARNRLTRHGRAITCCVHGSVYDPALGGQVLAGPAMHPLATITLQVDAASGGLVATGLLGTDLHKAFFRAHRKELRRRYGRKDWRRLVSGPATAMPLRKWTKLVVHC